MSEKRTTTNGRRRTDFPRVCSKQRVCSVYEVARAMLSRNLLRRLGPVRASSRIKQHFRARTEVGAAAARDNFVDLKSVVA